MLTDKVIKMGILPFAAIVFLIIFISNPDLYGQGGKEKNGLPDVQIDVKREYDENGNVSRYDSSYSFSWSYDGAVNMDSLFESLNNNFGISPFDDDEFFNRSFEPSDHFRMFPRHGQINPEPDNDSLNGYINPEDSICYFNKPYDFFERLHRRGPFIDTLDEFFGDSFFGQDPLYWPDFDMRSMMENHRKMMEEMHRYFEFNMPRYPLTPDSVPRNPIQQRHLAPPKPLPKMQEI